MTERFRAAASHADARQSVLGEGVCIAIAAVAGQRVRTHVAGARYNTRTVFKLASVTKILTDIALTAAIRRGKMAYNAPASAYLHGQRVPDFEGQPIRIEHLAAHTSGLPREATNLGGGRDPKTRYVEADMRAFLDHYSLTRAPGAAYEYSNVGYGLLGWLIGRVYGTTYADVVHHEITGPLGMSDTTTAVDQDQMARLLRGSRGANEMAVKSYSEVAVGMGGLFSTLPDMAILARALLDPPAGAIGEILDAYVSGRPNGWVYAQGGGQGFRSYFAASRPERQAAVVLINDFVNDPEEIGDYLMGRATALVVQEMKAEVTDDNYLGLYRFEDDEALVVSAAQEGFEVELQGLSVKFPLQERGLDRFALVGAGAIELAFIRDASGVVSSVEFLEPHQPVYVAMKQR